MENKLKEEENENIGDEKEIDSISKINIEKYKDPGGLTMKKLNFGLWYLEHKKILLNSLYVFLGLIGIVTWSSFFWTFGHYVLVGMVEDEKMVYELVQNPGISHEEVLKMAPKPIQVLTANVLLNSNGTYDLIAKISNINSRYYSRFTYSFKLGNETLGPFEGFILPSEEKFLILLDQKLSRRPSSVNLDLDNSWNKLDGRVINDWPYYRDNYIDFSAENKVFSNPRESNLSEKLNLSVVEFDMVNNSAYSYYQIDLDIILYSRGKMVSISQYPLEKFISGEVRHVNITWPGKITRADTIVVIPNIDIMAKDILFIP